MGGIFGFIRSFGKEKLSQAGESMTQMIVSWDPETASEAEIQEMIRELDNITVEAGKAKASYEKEKAEADAAAKNYNRFMAAAELLHKQYETAQSSGDQAKATELEASLTKLLKDLEDLQPEMERESQEAEEARTYYEEIRELAGITAQKVKSARAQLDKAQREMKRAEIERQRAQARSEKSEQMAGLRKQSSSLGVALAAMNKQAEQARASATAADMKAKLLSVQTEKQDQNIQQALQEVSGEPVTQTKSIADRIAALKK
jgi:DNA repair exonuclease SbcCD ATPase subunit